MEKQQDILLRLQEQIEKAFRWLENQHIVEKVMNRQWVKNIFQKPYVAYAQETLKPYQSKIEKGAAWLFIVGGAFGILKFLGALTAIGFWLKLSIGMGMTVLVFRIIGGIYSLGVLGLGIGLLNKKSWTKSLLLAVLGSTAVWMIACLLGARYGQGDILPKFIALIIEAVLSILLLAPHTTKHSK